MTRTVPSRCPAIPGENQTGNHPYGRKRMKRPACALAILATLLLPALEGCAKHPLTDSEFRGFCYTIVDRWASCDTIDICNDFDANALSKKEPSQQACLADCDMVANQRYSANWSIGCAPMLRTATDWCHKYCMDNYAR